MAVILPYTPHFAEVELVTQSCPPGHTLTWDHFATDNPQIFQTDTNSPGDPNIVFATDLSGLIIGTLQIGISGTTWTGAVGYAGFGFFTSGEIQVPTPAIGPISQDAQFVGWGGSSGDTVSASVTAIGGGTHTMASARLIVQFWPKPFNFVQVY